MAVITGIFFLLYGIKYFLYKRNNENIFIKIYDFVLSMLTTGLYAIFMLIFTAVYGMEKINTKIAVLLTVGSVLILVVKCLFIKKKSMKYTIALDIFYFIIFLGFISVG